MIDALAGPPPSAPAAGAQDRSLRSAVERHILDEVRRGRLRPGDRLVEAALAGTLGVSLTPVREALFHLVHSGLIVHRPRRGFYLAELGPAQVDELFTLRAALEGLAAAQAAPRLRPQEAAELERLIDAGVAAARAGDALGNAECNAAFHALVIRAARHTLLERAWGLVTPLRWLLMPAAVPALSEAETVDWERRHRRLLEALRSGDPQRAEAAAREHVVQSARRPRQRLAGGA
jgi:DNA-binding GntR family transcriptional regulator